MRKFSFFLLLLAFSVASLAQNKEQWVYAWSDKSLSDSTRFGAVYNLAWEYAYIQTDTALMYAQSAFEFANELNNDHYRCKVLNVLGGVYLIKSDLGRAKDYFEKALKLAEKINDSNALASAHNNLGGLHFSENNMPEAQRHYGQSYEIYLKTNNKSGQARALSNLGQVSEEQGEYQKALQRYESALATKQEVGDKTGTAYINIGNVYQMQQDLAKAEELYLRAIEQLKKEDDHWNLSDAYTDYADVRALQGDNNTAIEYYDKCIVLSEELNNPTTKAFVLHKKGSLYLDQNNFSDAKKFCEASFLLSGEIQDIENGAAACECLHNAYKLKGDFKNALAYHELFVEMSDSLTRLKSMDDVSKISLKHDYEMRSLEDSLSREEERIKTEYTFEAEINRKKNERNVFIVGAIFILLLAGVLANRLWFSTKTKKIIQKERERSDSLLLNILPAAVAQELKDKGKATTRQYSNVTVLFTDFKGFTNLAEQMSAEALISEVDMCFQHFDVIMHKYGLEKIKTIGDAYMAVAGLPEGNTANAQAAVLAALEMMQWVEERYSMRTYADLPAFRMRAGMHTGPAIAGVVGLNKFQYDVWGDTVNTSARIESSGEVGRVNISESTYQQVKNVVGFHFEARGKIVAKNKGEMEMYFVH